LCDRKGARFPIVGQDVRLVLKKYSAREDDQDENGLRRGSTTFAVTLAPRLRHRLADRNYEEIDFYGE
jgi:hypothetical protein